MPSPAELTLELVPRSRYDAIDVRRRVGDAYGGVLEEYPRALYCSFHTTAGYLEQSLSARLGHSRQYLDPFIRLFQKLFPPDADYRHDRLELRTELSPQQRETEPRNADSHLAFIGSGLRSCATYRDHADPVYFIDLDGVGPAGQRRRRTTVLAYRSEEVVARGEMAVPVAPHTLESLNLRDPRHGLLEALGELVERHGIEHGRVDLSLEPDERHAGLTVNEYETLLMRHDLAEVLRNPVRFVAGRGRSMLRDPLAIPGKTLSYARYDLVQMLNEGLAALQLGDSAVEGVLARCLGLPAFRFLRLRRSVSLLAAAGRPEGPIVLGRYQSPILVQWRRPEPGRRRLRFALVRFA